MSNLNKRLVPFVPLVPSTNGTISTISTNEYKYSLEPGSKKYQCPRCNKKTFVRYVDNETRNYLSSEFGRCDRESKCGYQNKPKAKSDWMPLIPYTKPKLTFIPNNVLQETLKGYEKNIFIQNLLKEFEDYEIENVVSQYYLGTVQNGYRAGAITFPFIDIKGNTRTIQVKQFDQANHTTGTDFLHSIIEKYYTKNKKPVPEWLTEYKKNEKKVSCLFGEHLLSKYPNKDIALVEAPKTAVYASLHFENFNWLAVYNLSSFSFDKLKALQGKTVFVFPDLSKDGKTFKEWQTKAKQFEERLTGTKFIFSDFLEQFASDKDKTEGKDIADYLVKHKIAPVQTIGDILDYYRNKGLTELPSNVEINYTMN